MLAPFVIVVSYTVFGLSGFGSGVGLMVVPMMTLAMPHIMPDRQRGTLGLVLPLLVAGDLLAVYQYRKLFSFPIVRRLLPGTAIGLAIGYGVCYFAERYQWVKLDQQVYSIPFVPFEPRALDGIWIAAAAMAVSLIATLYPARSATRIAPVESLRYE